MGVSRSVGAVLGCQWASGGVGEAGVYWKAGRDSRYSGARRGMGASVALGAPRGCRAIWGFRGHFGGIRGCQGYIGAGRDSVIRAEGV